MATASAISLFLKRQDDGSGSGSSSVDVWARLEQEDIPDSASEADLNDLHQMIAAAMSGESAYQYVYDSCPYVVIVDGVVTITLPFFVWLSSLDLAYELSASLGEISEGVLNEEYQSFDVIFDHTDSVDVGVAFTGTLVPQMPFFNDDGVEVPPPEITINGSVISFPEPLTTVLRAEGMAVSFKHNLILTITKAGTDFEENPTETTPRRDYSVEPPESAITVAWTDEAGDTQNDILDIEIPGCVIDLLATCEDGEFKADQPDEEPKFLLYYNDCDGSVLGGYWEDRKK